MAILHTFASEMTDCKQQLSVLYYPRYPGNRILSNAHVKLRVGSLVYANDRKPGTFRGFKKFAEKSRRKSFIEFPVSFDPDHIRICQRIFRKERTCADSVAFPLQYLDLMPKNALLHIPTGMAIELYLRSRKLGPEFQPQIFGNPRLGLSEGIVLDSIVASMPLVILGSGYAVKKIGIELEEILLSVPFMITGYLSIIGSINLLLNTEEIREDRLSFFRAADSKSPSIAKRSSPMGAH